MCVSKNIYIFWKWTKLSATNTHSPPYKRFYCSKMNTRSHLPLHLIFIHEINIADSQISTWIPFLPSQFVRLCLVLRAIEISQSTRSWKTLERQISRENSLPFLSSHPENFENSVAKVENKKKSSASNFFFIKYMFFKHCK